MAQFLKSPRCAGVWTDHTPDANVQSTLWVKPGQTAEFLLWGNGPHNERLDVVVEVAGVEVEDGSFLKGPFKWGESGFSPVSDDPGPTGGDVRQFSLRSAQFQARVVHARVGGTFGSDYAKPILVVWSDKDANIGPEIAAPAMSASEIHMKTLGYINRALGLYAGYSEEPWLWGAARSLGRERNLYVTQGGNRKPINCGNKPMAYAEHYLICRAMVASGGDTLGRAARCAEVGATVGVYEIGKALRAFIAFQKYNPVTWALIHEIDAVYKAGICPPTPPSPISISWSRKGCMDGLVRLDAAKLPISHGP